MRSNDDGALVTHLRSLQLEGEAPFAFHTARNSQELLALRHFRCRKLDCKLLNNRRKFCNSIVESTSVRRLMKGADSAIGSSCARGTFLVERLRDGNYPVFS